jgi:hypothetical protein
MINVYALIVIVKGIPHHFGLNILAGELPERSEGKRGGNEPLFKSVVSDSELLLFCKAARDKI